MAIPEAQLETWTNQGATVTSSQIYASIRACMNAEASKVRLRSPEIYLQGSYKNDTNIYGDSDVDIVVQLHTTWNRDLSALSPTERDCYLTTYPNATYHWEHFYDDVLQTLIKYYGQSNVDTTGKVLKVSTGKSYRADVVVATDYRKYLMFQNDDLNRYVEGIKFHIPNDGNRSVINYPKHHSDNGTNKNRDERTNGRYKPTVRMFKNIRNNLLDKKLILNKSTPSYFLECMLYNVPDVCFGDDVCQTFCDVINYLNGADLSKFICQNEQLALLGDASEQWKLEPASAFVKSAIQLWNTWQ